MRKRTTSTTAKPVVAAVTLLLWVDDGYDLSGWLAHSSAEPSWNYVLANRTLASLPPRWSVWSPQEHAAAVTAALCTVSSGAAELVDRWAWGRERPMFVPSGMLVAPTVRAIRSVRVNEVCAALRGATRSRAPGSNKATAHATATATATATTTAHATATTTAGVTERPLYERMAAAYLAAWCPSGWTRQTLFGNQTMEQRKREFRYYGARFTEYVRCLPLAAPEARAQQVGEAVLVEFRVLPNLEFTLRNAVHKLGGRWAHAVVCGQDNEAEVQRIVRAMAPAAVAVYAWPRRNVTVQEYSELLASPAFWTQFAHDRVLIYQEDACVFHGRLDPFFEYDYVGAPWPECNHAHAWQVGNGGFSLRRCSAMLHVLARSPYAAYVDPGKPDSVAGTVPEDVYFTQNIRDHPEWGLRLPSWESAKAFSVESLDGPPDVCGAHNSFIADGERWRQRYDRAIVKRFVKPRDFPAEHRGGWTLVKERLRDVAQSDWVDLATSLVLYDVLDEVAWNPDFQFVRRCRVDPSVVAEDAGRAPAHPWIAVVHFTPNPPPHLASCDVDNVLADPRVVAAWPACRGLITLAPSLQTHVRARVPDTVPVHCFVHPTDLDDAIPRFDFEAFLATPEKHVVQVGLQLRRVSSVFFLDAPPGWRKTWLTGTRDLARARTAVDDECEALRRPGSAWVTTPAVSLAYLADPADYDAWLCRHVVFLDLFHSAANNTVVECIARNTPLVVNRTPGVVDYLGPDYPLYYDTLADAAALLRDTNALWKGHLFLRRLDKSALSVDRFVQQVVRVLNACSL